MKIIDEIVNESEWVKSFWINGFNISQPKKNFTEKLYW